MHKKIGLLLGSFNPIHNGHLAIAGYCAEYTSLDEVWLVVSPHNPLKQANQLVPEHHRFEMVRQSVAAYNPKLQASNVEFDLLRPSYTIDTLRHLQQQHPQHEFTLLMGADSLASIEQWKEHETLLKQTHIMVYPRMGYNLTTLTEKYNVQGIDAPIIELSATFIRNALTNGKNVGYFIPLQAYEYLVKHKLYQP